MGKTVRVIAEIGVNHNGNVSEAKALVRAASDAGADAVKFQLFEAERLATRSAPLAAYQRVSQQQSEIRTQFELLRKLELSIPELQEIEECALGLGVDFFVSIFGDEFVESALDSFKSKTLKIPSGELTNERLIRKAASQDCLLLISTGMSYMSEVEEAVSWILASRPSLTDVCIMHCTSAYPTRPDEVNLKAISEIASRFGASVGYSDHTLSHTASTGAVALGASLLEKHLTLDNTASGPDHRASLTPKAFSDYVAAVREMEECLGSGVKEPTESELEVMQVVRKSPYASRAIRKGQKFDASNLQLKRPMTTLQGSRISQLVGILSTRNYEAGEPIDPAELA